MLTPHLAGAAAAVFVAYFLGLAVYRLYIHPLSRYPGPNLAALSDWYSACYAARGDLHLQTHQWHLRYGHAVRIGPDTIVFNDVPALRQIYGPNLDLTKSRRYAAGSASRTSNLLSDSGRDKPTVAMKRKAYQQMWNDRSLEQIEPELHGMLDKLFVNLEQETGFGGSSATQAWSANVNAHKVCEPFGFDATVFATVGVSPELMSTPERRWMMDASAVASWRASVANQQPKLHDWHLDKLLLWPWYRSILGLGTWTKDQTKARTSSGPGNGPHDLVEIMMQAVDEKRGLAMSDKEMWLEVMTMTVIGVASIAPLLSTTLFYLAHYPETFTRLAHELRTTFASESDIRLSTLLTSCPYLLACLDETFRMNPVLANAVFRDVSPTGAVVGDQAYPPGASLGVALWCLHRNEAHFSQPHKFVPERYLGSTEEERAYAKRAWFPFSTGPRTCVGKRLAYVVVGLAVARLVWRFDMRLAPDAPCCGGKPAEKKCTDRTYKSWIGLGVDGPVVQFMPRS